MSKLLTSCLKSRGQGKRARSVLAVAGFALGFAGAASAWADDGHSLKVKPEVFIGKAGDCGTGYPAGSRIVTAAWLKGLGLPDNGGSNVNPLNSQDNPNKKDPHSGLLLSKNGPTPDCSSAGAEIKGVKGMTVGSGFELGFDYRNGTHCGAGAPRFNVTYKTGSVDGFSFVGGCANGTATPAPQDSSLGVQWTRVRFDTSNSAQSFPPIPTGSIIKSIEIVFDEGTDTSSTDDPNGVGLSVLDNIDINKVILTSKHSVEEEHQNHDDDDDDIGKPGPT